jgi:hypothetical protein
MDLQSIAYGRRVRSLASFCLLATMVACAKGNADSNVPVVNNDTGNHTSVTYAPLAWETSDHPERVAWSAYLLSQIATELPTLSNASDITNFCPTYKNLTTTEQTEVWGDLMVWDSYFESGWDPTNRYEETTLGIDPVTHEQVWSEGLMQMSYQDTLWMPSCRFNWNVDKNLSATDPNKTILNPEINLQCGVFVLSNQIKLYGAVGLSDHLYWSTLRAGSTDLHEIEAHVQNSLAFCR